MAIGTRVEWELANLHPGLPGARGGAFHGDQVLPGGEAGDRGVMVHWMHPMGTRLLKWVLREPIVRYREGEATTLVRGWIATVNSNVSLVECVPVAPAHEGRKSLTHNRDG